MILENGLIHTGCNLVVSSYRRSMPFLVHTIMRVRIKFIIELSYICLWNKHLTQIATSPCPFLTSYSRITTSPVWSPSGCRSSMCRYPIFPIDPSTVCTIWALHQHYLAYPVTPGGRILQVYPYLFDHHADMQSTV